MPITKMPMVPASVHIICNQYTTAAPNCNQKRQSQMQIVVSRSPDRPPSAAIWIYFTRYLSLIENRTDAKKQLTEELLKSWIYHPRSSMPNQL